MTEVMLKGIRRRLTIIGVGVLAIALIDGIFLVTHPQQEWHECRCD